MRPFDRRTAGCIFVQRLRRSQALQAWMVPRAVFTSMPVEPTEDINHGLTGTPRVGGI